MRAAQQYHHPSSKGIYRLNHEQYQEPSNLRHKASNSFTLPRNRYKGYKHFQEERKPKLHQFQPESNFENSHFDNQFLHENNKYLQLATPSGNDYVTIYNDYEPHKNIIDSHGKRQQEAFRKQVTQAQNNAKQQYHWYGSDELLVQAENENDSFETSNSDEVQGNNYLIVVQLKSNAN